MKKTKKQKRYHFTQVSGFISEGGPNAQQDQGRDEKLVDNIQRAIEKEEFLSTVLGNIQVMANSGVVTLEGTVSTEQQKIVAGERAAAFAGFNNINNNLQVRRIF